MEIKLSQPVIFADLNAKEQKDPNYARDRLTVEALKYKHIRNALKYPEMDQLHHLMLLLTGLSEDDIGELAPEDAALIGNYVFESMKKYMQLGTKMLKGLEP